MRWSAAVHRWAPFTLVAWILVAVALALAAPSWRSIAADGDFEYLPAETSSVAGGRLLDRAFAGERARSQIVFVLARDSGKLTKDDDLVGLDLLRRLYHRLAEVSWRRGIETGYRSGPIDPDADWAHWIGVAVEALDRSIELDDQFYERLGDRVPDSAPTFTQPRMAIAYADRAELGELLRADADGIEADREAAATLVGAQVQSLVPVADRDLDDWRPLLDILSWDDAVIGGRLKTDSARLAILQLSSELAATGNIRLLEAIDSLKADVIDYTGGMVEPGLQLLRTGSAAIGGETLTAARDAIRYTESITALMILLILIVVYRAPLLVAVPMLSIGVAVVVATSLVSILAGWSMASETDWLDVRVFTTSRIFIVVILFGAGTDYCLFLIARLREEAAAKAWPVACRDSLGSVMGALLGSALTTVVGLGMLWFAEFGKFHHTGPIIAICLLVGLLVCTTLTPALLALLGPAAFWPVGVPTAAPARLSGEPTSIGRGLWGRIAIALTRHPAAVLFAGLAVLAVPAVYGFGQERNVTYDLSSGLSPTAEARRGLKLIDQHFSIGEFSPVVVLVVNRRERTREELTRRSRDLAEKLYAIDEVATVRTIDDPLGDFPPDRGMSLLSGDAWRRRALKNHRVSRRYFFAQDEQLRGRLFRLDVTIDDDPFSLRTAAVVEEIDRLLAAETGASANAETSSYFLAGTTPSIMDLRSITLSDNRRIKVAVVAAVFLVLVLVVRRVGLCVYLIATVLISYYATIGLTVLFFRTIDGDAFVGLDWKLPLFLFVILVAVGQDYNVYLVTRIIEEQRRLGWLAAVRRSVARTGGIITACGVVMAATFLSMTAAAWLPPLLAAIGRESAGGGSPLRGIVELGFALGLGVLIDTFYVRTILVPTFVCLMGGRVRSVSGRTGSAAPVPK